MKAHARHAILAASGLLTLVGGALDAWTYLAHGHVFATAQSGNVVLMGVALSRGDWAAAAHSLPSLIAFVVAMLASRLTARPLKRAGLNSRTYRLAVESGLLVALALVAGRVCDAATTAAVGFIAGLQITSLSHIGRWSFNTGMTTGNLRAAATAFSEAVAGKAGEWPRALTMAGLCLAFALGALCGAWLTPVLDALALVPLAVLVALAAAMTHGLPDPLPDWDDLR